MPCYHETNRPMQQLPSVVGWCSLCVRPSFFLVPKLVPSPAPLSFRSVELQKANLGNAGNGEAGGTSTNTNSTAGPLASAIPLAQLLTKPGALNALSSLSALGGLTELLGSAAPIQTTGVHRSHRGPNRPRSPAPQNNSGDQPVKNKSERNKFNPY